MYLFVIFFLLTLYVLAIRNRISKYTRLADCMIGSLLFLFFVIRFNIGRDLISYCVSFYVFKQEPYRVLEVAAHRNTLYFLLIGLCVKLFNDYRWVMLVFNVISLSLCAVTIYRNSKNMVFSWLILIGSGVLEVYYASGIRQMTAMSIFFFGFYTFLPKKKYVLYELFVLIAFLFHETVIVAAFIPLLIKAIPLLRKKPIKLTLYSAAVSILFSLLIGFALPKFLSIENIPWEYINVIGYFSKYAPSILGIGMEAVILAGTFYIYIQADKKEDSFLDLQYLTILFSVLIYFLFMGFPNISRVSDSIQIITIIYLPNLILLVPALKKRILCTISVLCFNAFLLYADMSANLPAAGRDLNRDISIQNDPYITVFNTKWIDASFEHYEWYPYHRHLTD